MLCCGTAMATDGYFQHGYGIQAKGRGGTAMAIATDAFGGANNPATMVMAGSRLDLDLDAFSPRRSAERSGLGPGLDGSVDSGRTWFGIPELGYSHAAGQPRIGNQSVRQWRHEYRLPRWPVQLRPGTGKYSVRQHLHRGGSAQLIIAPTAAYAITPNQSIGIAPQIALQRFAAKGLQAFASTPGLSSAPGSVTNNGAEMSSGVGVRFGYFARISPAFSFGAAYSSKIGMSRFKDYAGLFAQAGKFDIPENYSLGVAWNATAALTLSADYERINYSGVQSVSNPSLVQAQLGASGGPGFGWHDVDVWKLGAEYASSDRWSWRAGYNHGSNPIRGSDVTFNILAPGVVTDHVTLGLTRTTASGVPGYSRTCMPSRTPLRVRRSCRYSWWRAGGQ